MTNSKIALFAGILIVVLSLIAVMTCTLTQTISPRPSERTEGMADTPTPIATDTPIPPMSTQTGTPTPSPTRVVDTATPPPTATDTPTPVLTPTATDIPPLPTASNTPVPEATETPPPAIPTATSAPRGGKPFGAFNYTFDDRWPMFTTSRLSGDVNYLQRARQAGASVLVSLTGGKSRYTDADGCFDLDMWKASLDHNNLTAIQQFVDDGTIWGLYAIDEPHDWDCGPSYQDLNEICRYAHQELPGIRCGFNTPPVWLQQGLGETDYGEVDYFFTQTNFNRTGNWETWAAQQQADASAVGNKPLWLSINLHIGGPRPDHIRDAGLALCRSSAVGVTMWKIDHVSEEMRPAMEEIAAACGAP